MFFDFEFVFYTSFSQNPDIGLPSDRVLAISINEQENKWIWADGGFGV